MRRPWASPLTPLYRLGVAGKNLSYSKGWRRPRHLNGPVISVGSLSAGGAGKTPIVLMLAELLHRHGVASDVLSRGYGRASNAVEHVDPAGPASRFGDEPLQLAQAGIDVYVGAERFQAGLLAEQRSSPPAASPPVHLLDDGFQHRRLARSLDIVLLTAEDVRDSLLPAGNLREPLASLRRADVIVLRADEADPLKEVAERHSRAEIWLVQRHLLLPPQIPSPVLAFCAIARPEGFFAMLPPAGCPLAAQVAFPDHHLYSAADVQRLVSTAREAGASGFVTTAKDAVKLSPDQRAALEQAGPLIVAPLRVTLTGEDAAWTTLRTSLRSSPE